MKQKRTLIRWLLSFGFCKAGLRKFVGMSPEKAWATASPDEKQQVATEACAASSSEVGCFCRSNNSVRKAGVFRAFRKWQRA